VKRLVLIASIMIFGFLQASTRICLASNSISKAGKSTSAVTFAFGPVAFCPANSTPGLTIALLPSKKILILDSSKPNLTDWREWYSKFSNAFVINILQTDLESSIPYGHANVTVELDSTPRVSSVRFSEVECAKQKDFLNKIDKSVRSVHHNPPVSFYTRHSKPSDPNPLCFPQSCSSKSTKAKLEFTVYVGKQWPPPLQIHKVDCGPSPVLDPKGIHIDFKQRN